MNKCFIVTLVLTLALPGLAFSNQTTSMDQAQSPGGFRENPWGTLKEQIQKAEQGKLVKSEKVSTGLDALVYEENAGGMDCAIGYFFAENKLVQGRYVFLQEHSNRTLFIDDYNKVKNSLIEKYGKPGTDNIIWRNNLYKDDPGEWGMAIAVGHLIYASKWKTADMEINLQLFGDNHKITFILDYQSMLPEHVELRKQAQEKATKGIW